VSITFSYKLVNACIVWASEQASCDSILLIYSSTIQLHNDSKPLTAYAGTLWQPQAQRSSMDQCMIIRYNMILTAVLVLWRGSILSISLQLFKRKPLVQKWALLSLSKYWVVWPIKSFLVLSPILLLP